MKIPSFFKNPESKKQCFRCGDTKLHRFFQKDTKKKDGLRSSCKECSNAGRREKPKKKVHFPITKKMKKAIRDLDKIPALELPVQELVITKVIDSQIAEAVIPSKESYALARIFQDIEKKHAAPLSISYYKNGKYRIQTHGNPAHTWTGCIEEILPKAMR